MAKIFLLDTQKQLYLGKLTEACKELPESTVVASVRYTRQHLDFVPNIVVSTFEGVDVDLQLEMFNRGAQRVVMYTQDLGELKTRLVGQN